MFGRGIVIHLRTFAFICGHLETKVGSLVTFGRDKWQSPASVLNLPAGFGACRRRMQPGILCRSTTTTVNTSTGKTPAPTPAQPEEKLCVKELADKLGISVRYVYEMRRCGFKMDGAGRFNQTTSKQRALAWIEENDFHMIDGAGIVNGERTQ